MQRPVPPRPRLAELAAATPPDRDRFLDLLRAGSILLVVLGHWLMAAVVRRDGALRADNALAAVTWLQPLTWLLQVMPVFFMVSGSTNARALGRGQATTAAFLARRARRLLPATLGLVVVWLALAAVLTATSLPAATVRDATSVAAQPLWFLAVYLLLVLVAPAQLRLHRRHPWLVLLLAPAVTVALDAGRLNGVAGGLAIFNYLAVFAVAQELGFCYADGTLYRLPRRVAAGAAAAGIGVLVLLTTVGPYPVSMVGVPGEKASNMSPPTLCVLVVTVVQVGLLLAFRTVLLRWLARPRVWLATVAVNAVVLTVFLWHLSAFVVASVLLAGIGGLVGDPGTMAWWVAKPAYVLVSAVGLVVLVAIAVPVERRARGATATRRTGVVALGVTLAALGLAGVAASGFVHPLAVSGRALLGVRFSPAAAVGLLVVGAWLAAGPSARAFLSGPAGGSGKMAVPHRPARGRPPVLDATTVVPLPVNEQAHAYAPGSLERASLESRLKELAAEPLDLTATVGGVQAMASGERFEIVQPHRHRGVLGTTAESGPGEWQAAVDAALLAAPAWRETSYDDRAAVLLRAAELLAGPWRATLNAATMLGQSKTAYQAEIDSACELVDFLRFNVAFGRQVLAEQPVSSPGVWNRMDHRPLEGFVLAITPFNFTAIAGNLPLAPALMGNTVVWKPSHTQQFAAHFLMRLLEAAGMPAGVVNMVTGYGTHSAVAVEHPDLAGIHFTGSTAVFQRLWQQVGTNISRYRTYPRLVGETGGKDFVLAHSSADVTALEVALVRGAFEFQGQKCSAASRAYVPRALWEGGLRDALVARTESLTYGDVTDLSNFGGAVIDRKAWTRLAGVVRAAHDDPALSVLAGGTADDSEGFFVRPTVIETSDPTHEVMSREYFGPVLGVYVYDDWDDVLPLVDRTAPYALTGAVFAQDVAALAEATQALRFTAGNFYLNDKPTGAVVGQQPFGGARASGTNDKAGSALNLLRWTSPRVLKTTLVPPHDHRYPHMG